jgi:hypothetical protein
MAGSLARAGRLGLKNCRRHYQLCVNKVRDKALYDILLCYNTYQAL